MTALVMTGLGAGLQAYGAYQQSKANQAAYSQQSEVNQDNSAYAQMQAEDALDRGREAERLHRRNVKGFKGKQRANLAASGVSLDEGSALNILADTDYLGEQDAMTIRENAEREAQGFRQQAKNYRANASLLASRAASENPTLAGVSSFLGGSGQVASQWYSGKAVGAFG